MSQGYDWNGWFPARPFLDSGCIEADIAARTGIDPPSLLRAYLSVLESGHWYRVRAIAVSIAS